MTTLSISNKNIQCSNSRPHIDRSNYQKNLTLLSYPVLFIIYWAYISSHSMKHMKVSSFSFEWIANFPFLKNRIQSIFFVLLVFRKVIITLPLCLAKWRGRGNGRAKKKFIFHVVQLGGKSWRKWFQIYY